MFKFFKKLNFLIKKPRIIIITGRGREGTAEAIYRVLDGHFSIRKIIDDSLPWLKKKEILIFQSEIKKFSDFQFLVKKSSLPLLVVTHLGEYFPEREFFAAELNQISEIRKLAEILPPYSFLILNFDDETVRDLKNKSLAHSLTFGFGARAEMRASDIVLISPQGELGGGTNFKINYQGNIVPIWLENLFGKEEIYTALAAAAVGEILNLNLVEVSEALKLYRGQPGRIKLIRGIKNSWILDNSTSPSLFSTMETLEILKKINIPGRKIAALGDVVGIGQYTIEAHEAIGEKVAKNVDLLFTFGPRAKFIAEGAKRKGMVLEGIFQYDRVEDGCLSLQKALREGDLIILSGSKEIKMEKILEEIKEVKKK